MDVTLGRRIRHAWNAFLSRDQTAANSYNLGTSYGTRPDRLRLDLGNERSIVSSVYTRVGIDVSSVAIQHVRVNQIGRYEETILSGLNSCLTLEANLDQSGRAFVQDVVMSMFDEGCVAIVPTDTTINPSVSGSYDILTLRTAKILEWYPNHVRVDIYNDRIGRKQDIILPKRTIAIIENPLYALMNEPNSTLKRLIYKLNLLDAIDEQSSSGKLDLIIQLPYVIKTEARRVQAAKRREDIQDQLKDSKYGIAYTDGTEKVTQLNRPAENNLMTQIEYLTRMLYGQLGLTESIFDGTADEKELLNYYSRTVEPVLMAITDGLKRSFLTKTARSQGQSIMYFRDPFKLVPVNELADIADKFTRNEILTSNELRSIIGYKPSADADADELRNKNLNPAKMTEPENAVDNTIEKGVTQNE